MLEFDAVYFDGKSSAANKVSGQYNPTTNKIQFHLNKELFSWDITNCSLEKLINQLTITNNSSFEQIVITQKEAIGIISKKNSNSFSSLYNGLIGAGIKVHLLIIAFILSCIIFANFYVLPNVAEKCVFLIPTSYDNQIGESFYNQFIDYQDIDSSKTVILNKFNRNEDLSRKINLRLFDEKLMLAEKEIVIDENKEIPTKDILPGNLTNGAVWYVFSGSRLEDLNIFSTFYPKNKAGYVEHAF